MDLYVAAERVTVKLVFGKKFVLEVVVVVVVNVYW